MNPITAHWPVHWRSGWLRASDGHFTASLLLIELPRFAWRAPVSHVSVFCLWRQTLFASFFAFAVRNGESRFCVLSLFGCIRRKFRAVATGVSWPAGRSDMLSPRSDGANAL